MPLAVLSLSACQSSVVCPLARMKMKLVIKCYLFHPKHAFIEFQMKIKEGTFPLLQSAGNVALLLLIEKEITLHLSLIKHA